MGWSIVDILPLHEHIIALLMRTSIDTYWDPTNNIGLMRTSIDTLWDPTNNIGILAQES